MICACLHASVSAPLRLSLQMLRLSFGRHRYDCTPQSCMLTTLHVFYCILQSPATMHGCTVTSRKPKWLNLCHCQAVLKESHS